MEWENIERIINVSFLKKQAVKYRGIEDEMWDNGRFVMSNPCNEEKHKDVFYIL